MKTPAPLFVYITARDSRSRSPSPFTSTAARVVCSPIKGTVVARRYKPEPLLVRTSIRDSRCPGETKLVARDAKSIRPSPLKSPALKKVGGVELVTSANLG